MFQIASVYQTTVIATFTCIAIRRQFQAPQLLTTTTAAVATGSCLLLGVAVHVPAFIAGELIAAVQNCFKKFMVDNYDPNEYDECRSNITTANNLYLYLHKYSPCLSCDHLQHHPFLDSAFFTPAGLEYPHASRTPPGDWPLSCR